MKKIELGKSVGMLANIGVLIGILLLVYELNQNREMMQAQTRNSLNEGLLNVLSTLGASEVVALSVRAENGEDLSEVEASQLGFMQDLRLRYYENVHYQYRNGLYEEEEFLAQLEIWRRILRSPILQQRWCFVRDTYSPAFVAEIDALISPNSCD